MHEPGRVISRSTKRARDQSRDRWNLDNLDAALEVGVRRSPEEKPDEAILIETEGGVQRMRLCKMLDDLERDLENFEALRVCVG